MYAYKKKAMGDCLCLCCFSVSVDHVCEFAMAVPSVDASATHLVCVLCVKCVCVCVCV